MILIPFACFIFGGAVVYLYFAYKEREPKTDNDTRKFAMAMSEKVEKQLREENAELKERYSKVDIIGYDALKNLTKATEIIKKLLPCCRNYPQENAEKMEQAEQFLKEIEKWHR